MPGLVIGLLILIILILVLIALFIDEKRLKSIRSPTGKMTEYWDGGERRKSVRVKTVLETRYSIDTKPSTQKKNSLSKNISIGGILMQANEKLFPAALLLLDIFLPDGERPVTARGEVAWVRGVSHMDNVGRRLFDTGIKFISMSPKDKERLDKHIKGLI